MIEGKTRKRVARELERLEDEYGSVSLCEETVTNEPEYFEHGRELAREGWIGDAGAWVTDNDDRVCLIRHKGAPDTWGTPGGGHEPPETLAETARREVREETGIECSLTGIYWARQKTVVLKSDPSQRLSMLTVEFEAEYERGTLTISDPDILEAKWFSEPPEIVTDALEGKVEAWTDA